MNIYFFISFLDSKSISARVGGLAFQIKLAICNYVLVNNGQVCISRIDQIILFTHFKFHFWSFWPHAFESLSMEIRIFKSTPNWAHYFHFNSYASAEPMQEPYFSMIVSKRSGCCSSSLHKLHKVRFGCHDPSFVPPIGGGFLRAKYQREIQQEDWAVGGGLDSYICNTIV